eukprot:8125617-Pyramimonas_sp.AAC.1
MIVAHFSLVLLMFIRHMAMWSRCSHRSSHEGKGKHRLPGTASRALLACPAPFARGSRGLQNNSEGRPVKVCKFSEEGVPALEMQQERRETPTKIVVILVQLLPLPREAIASFCDEPPLVNRVLLEGRRVATAQGSYLR